ncbi:MAG: hypothetical protein PHQ14_00860 [Chromatiales bacterium]|nr:hypothetical protein [Chromatiales bacterium]
MSDRYAREWNEFRRKNRTASLVLILGPLVVVLVALMSRTLIGDKASGLFIALMVGWALVWGWLAFRAVRHPCPRCGVAFLANQDAWVRRCGRCGLELYGEQRPSDSTWTQNRTS